MIKTTGRSVRWWASLAAAGMLVLAACGDDSDDSPADAADADADDAAEADVTDAGDVGSGDIAAACDGFFAADAAFLGLDEVFAEGPDAAQAYVTEEVVPAAQQFGDNAPDEIAAEADVLVSAIEAFAETGDPEALGVFDSPEGQEADQAVGNYLFDSCEGEKVDVELVNFAFEGVPDSLPTGRAMFRVSNSEETELHEMILVKRNPGTDEPAAELLALDEEEAFEKVTPAAFAFAAPGEELVTGATLEPGEYIMACFVPEGATFEDLEAFFEGEEDVDPAELGTPHHELGMYLEFTVN